MSANPPGGPFIVGEYPSPNRLNRKVFTHVTGSEVGSLTTIPNMAVIVTADGGQYTKDQFIIRNSDNTAWLSSTAGKHTHNQDDDLHGGLQSEINYFNATIAYSINMASMCRNDFASVGTATMADDNTNGRVYVQTAGSAGSYGFLAKHGVPLSFARRSRFILKGYVTDGNNLTVRAGVGAEDVNQSPTTGYACYGMEICDTTGTDRNWDCFTGNGTARSGEQSTAPVETTTPRFYRFDYTPGQNVIMYVNNSAVKTKSTNVPLGTGSFTYSRGMNNVGWGVKTANTTAKTFYCYGLMFQGAGADAAWQ